MKENNVNELNAIVSDALSKSRSNLIRKRKYRYPLAIPTYGAEEVLEAIDSMTSFNTSMWEKVRAFEQSFGQRFGGEAIMVNSGSSADLVMTFALMSQSGGKLQRGDEILVPAVTWPTHVWSALMAGFVVRFVDVDPETLNFRMEDLKRKISKRTRAVFVVHLLGNMGDLNELRNVCKEQGLILIEDCCEALGSSWDGKNVGNWGLAGSFSFFFSHHMMTMEGGMIITSDSEFARRCRLLRSHGWTRFSETPIRNTDFFSNYVFETWGFNLRPTELQASFGLHQLNRIDLFQHQRLSNAKLLEDVVSLYQPLIRTMKVWDKAKCSWFAFPIMVSKNANFTRDELAAFFDSQGIETRPIVAGNLARQPAVSRLDNLRAESLPGADEIHDFGLYIGIHPVNDPEGIRLVETSLKLFMTRQGL